MVSSLYGNAINVINKFLKTIDITTKVCYDVYRVKKGS